MMPKSHDILRVQPMLPVLCREQLPRSCTWSVLHWSVPIPVITPRVPQFWGWVATRSGPGPLVDMAGRQSAWALMVVGVSMHIASELQVLYMPRELLEQKVLKAPRLRTLSGVNAPPPPIQRTPSRDGLHRAPAAASSEALPPAQVLQHEARCCKALLMPFC